MSIAEDAIALRLIDPPRAREIRERAKLPGSWIAMELRVDPYTVRRWETGASRPRGRMRLRYARLLAQLNEINEAA
ncbi:MULTISPECIES: hypothetical protein [unclassified Microbacterium]|uniref:hypothetical protein n=1 Tax=unclassified Microbacterium TaxID=2609290 RepID=UPI0011AF07AA|nr:MULTISPECIES: hypothetical protein [unclassified Microbacterium]